MLLSRIYEDCLAHSSTPVADSSFHFVSIISFITKMIIISAWAGDNELFE